MTRQKHFISAPEDKEVLELEVGAFALVQLKTHFSFSFADTAV